MRVKLIAIVTLLTLARLCASGPSARACNGPVAANIRNSLRASYKNFAEPDFSFLRSRPDARVAGLVSGISNKGFEVRDVRDPDRDVSFTYSVKRGPVAWRLCLSMAGPYAAIFRLDRNSKTLFTSPASAPEREVVQLVRGAGYTLLDAATLSCPAQVKMPQTVRQGAPDRVRFWQALFRDHPKMPWEE